MRKYYFELFLSFILLSFALKAQNPHNNSLATRLKNHVAFLASDSLEGRGLGTEGKILAKNYIARHFSDHGLKPAGDDYFQHFDLRIGMARVPATNVVGFLPGSDSVLQAEYIVIGAHYDHLGYEYDNSERVIYHGADDNASGTAVLIELAGYFSRNPELRGRSIIFIAFDAEESGLLGAERFIKQNTMFGIDKIRLMFSLDMVGMYDANSGLELLGIGTLDNGIEIARKAAGEHGVRLQNTTADIPVRTDTRPFGDSGIPAVQAFTGLESPYHKPEDTYDLLDYEGMARITEYLITLVSELSLNPELVPSRRFARLQRPFGLHFSTGALTHTGSTYNRYPDEFYQANSVFAFSTGFFMQMHFGRKFTIQPEILYDYNGSRSPEGSYRRHSLTMPVNLHLYLASDPGGFIKVYPITGGYFRFNLAGKEGGVELDFENLHPSQEWGINFGFGIQIMKLHLAYTLRRGLTDISSLPGTKIYNSGGYFTLGYRF
jgi:aminopeptidase YwaD